MEQISKIKIEKTNKNQERDGTKKKMPDFLEDMVFHGPKIRKNLHSKFFFRES